MNSTSISPRTLVTIIVTGILLVVGGLIISTSVPSLFPQQASAESKQVDDLFRILLIIGGAIFLLVQGLLVYSVWRFRAKPGDTTDGLHIHGNTTLEIVWTAIPAVIVLVLSVLSWQVWNDIQAPKDNEMTIVVDGRRFNWAFTYDVPMSILPSDVDVSRLPQEIQNDINDDDAVTVTSPEMHTYLGRPVVLSMQPQDVIHALWVPAFRIKQDLIPGRVTTLRYTAVEVPGETYPATYPIRCAELCGANHGLMISTVVVHKDEADFNAWLAQQADPVIHPSADPVVAGEQILTSGVYPCPTCHVETNLGWAPAAPLGPSLNGVADRAATSRSSATGLSPADYLLQAVHDPTAYIVPGFQPLMPQLNIPQCQALAIVAYLCTQSESGTATCTVPNYAEQCGGAPPPPPGEATAEATSGVVSGEATAEATGEATAEVTNEATTEATAAPTSEATIEATAESTTEATAEATASS